MRVHGRGADLPPRPGRGTLRSSPLRDGLGSGGADLATGGTVIDGYRQRGVSAEKEEVHRAIRAASAGEVPGAFCKLVPDVGGDGRTLAALHADGAGTKAIVAYLAWKECGDASVFEGIAQDSAVMNVDDLACVGAVDELLLSNTIGRNAHRVDGSVLEAVISGYERFSRRMADFGVRLRTTGGETADVGDLVATIVVDSTVYARIRREDVVDASRMRPGQVLVGLSSTGQAAWEDEPNSGIGSNGLTLARHVLLGADYADRYPESWSPTLERDVAYVGPYGLDDRLPGTDRTVAWGLLSPTRSYAPLIREVLSRCREAVGGILHCTGGGQTKCLSFGSGLRFVKDDLFETPAVFRAIREAGGVASEEMYRVFNMGHRMEIAVDASAVDAIRAAASAYGIDSRVVGRIESNDAPDENRLVIRHEGAEHEYRKRRAS